MWRDGVGEGVPLLIFAGESAAEADEILPNDVADVHVKMGEVVMFWEKREDFGLEIVCLEIMM